MKHLPWMAAVLVFANGVVACSDDADEAPAPSGGSSSVAGKASGASGTPAQPEGGGGSATGGSSTSSAGMGGAAQPAAKDIVDTAVAAGSFTRLAAALTQAGLVGALKGDGPFTVFAPDDAAFEAFDDENPGVLAGLSKAELTEVLKYHVVAGSAVESTALKDDQVFLTLSGSPVLVDRTGGVKISESNVTSADVVASNGVIHVIDRIMLPPKDDIVATAIAAGMFTTLAGALTEADLVTALQGAGPFTVFAPTDAAFAKLAEVPEGDALKDVLLYHVVEGAVGSGDLKAGPVPTLLEGKSVTIKLTGGVTVDASKVTTANVIAKNGVIHVVDTVLVPE